MNVERPVLWHSLQPEKVVEHLESHLENGLSREEAKIRLQKYGPNELTQKADMGPLLRFLLQFHQPLVYILLAAAFVTLLLGEYVDSSVIFAVVLVNAIVGYTQEARAIHALEALAKSMQAQARVLRDGKLQIMNAAQLVPGDIVSLQSGEKVPADLRILRIHELRIDESALTGESVPVEKSKLGLEEKTQLADQTCMAFASTFVTFGQGKGIVVATGNETEVGRISQLISQADALETPLTRKIKQFSKSLLWIILGLAALTFIAGMIRDMAAVETFMAAVALAVAAIPEGLPAAFTIILAIGVGRIAARNAIIRKLPAVETLGSTTVICSDKTGTLTRNEMTVQSVATHGNSFSLSGAGYSPHGRILDAHGDQCEFDDKALHECLLAGLLCNDAILEKRGEEWVIEGDPTEGALIVSARKAGLSEEHYKEVLARSNEIPFESDYQYMATLHQPKGEEGCVIYVKGATEVLIEKCTQALDGGGNLVSVDRKAILDQMSVMAKNGLRVLAFAKKTMSTDLKDLTHDDIDNDLVFLGLQGMIDPPRPEAIEAIQACHRAGIAVKMITGDHSITAGAIARQMDLAGLGHAHELNAMNGQTLSQLSDEELQEVVETTHVFARVTPEQKLRLVQALQHHGHVSAMTGDGVNDAPALKQADIGVAMGLGGTEVAREAADMVLTDDNFATIRDAVEEGRCVFDNLTKFIVWTLPTNIGEGMIVLFGILMGWGLPVLPVHILWINMSTALLLGMMLAFEHKETGIMSRSPRDPQAPILSRALFFRVLLVAAFMTLSAFVLYNWELARGSSLEVARTSAVNVIVFIELFYLFNCRSLDRSIFSMGFFSNGWLIFGVITMAGLQLVFTYAPFAQTIFKSAAIDVMSWAVIIGAGLVTNLIVALHKRATSRPSETVHFVKRECADC